METLPDFPRVDECDLEGEDFKEILGLYMQGASDNEVKAYIVTVSNSYKNESWDSWIETNPNFKEVITRGRLLAEAWWEREGRLNLHTPKYNYTGWYNIMKNRYGWSDKSTLVGDPDNPLKLDGAINITFVTPSGEKLSPEDISFIKVGKETG